MKILQVCSATSIGGGEQHVIDLTRGLLERGHELHLAIRPHSPLQQELANAPIHWHEIKLRNALDLFSAKQLTNLILTNKIEVVHAHIARDYPLTGWATRELPVRLFLTRHHFNPIKSNSLYRAALNHATQLIAVSETVRRELAKAFPALKNRIEVIPNWLRYTTTINRAEARKHFAIQRPLAVAMIGQITPLKRQDLLLDAMHLLPRDNVFEQADFFMLGTASVGDNAYEQSLRQKACDLGLTDRVHFTGFVPDLPKYLAAFDVVVAPSDNEGFSLATIEAMYAGCAVLASNIGGFAEIITHGETGLLSPPNKAESLAINLHRLLVDPNLRERLASAAQTMVSERYDRERILDRIAMLYQKPAK